MKKMLSVLLAVTMLLTLSAGVFAEGETAEYPWPKYDEIKTVTVWFAVNYDCPDVELVQDAINAISEERYGIHYNFVVLSWGQFESQLNLALMGDGECDVFLNWNVMPTFQNGQLYDMTDFFNSDPLTDTIGEWDYRIQRRNCVDGKVCALQNLYDFGHYLSLNITEDVAEFYGIEEHTELSLAEIDELLGKIKVDFPDRYPLAPGQPLISDFWTWDTAGDNVASGVLPNRGQDEELKLECIFDNEDYITAANYTRSWYEKGYVTPDVLSNTTTGFASLSSGQAACSFDTYGINPIAGAVRTRVKEIGCWCQSSTGYGYSINSLTKNPEAAYRALTLFWYDDEIATLLNNGIEGVTYTKNDDGTISYISGDPATCGWGAATMYWVFPGAEKARPIDSNGPTFYDDLYELNNNMLLSKAYGFIYNPDNEYDAWVACSSVIQNYFHLLTSGAVDIESTLAEAKQAWLDAGGEQLMADKQAQLDAWLANQ